MQWPCFVPGSLDLFPPIAVLDGGRALVDWLSLNKHCNVSPNYYFAGLNWEDVLMHMLLLPCY